MLRDEAGEQRSARRVRRLPGPSQSIGQNRNLKLRVFLERFIQSRNQLVLGLADVEGGQVYSSSSASNLGLDIASAGRSKLIIRLNNLQCFIESCRRVENLNPGGLNLELWGNKVKLGRDANQWMSDGCCRLARRRWHREIPNSYSRY